jgi:undecaprenyl-diphosphatase
VFICCFGHEVIEICKCLIRSVKKPALLVNDKSRPATLLRSIFVAVIPTVLIVFVLSILHIKIQQTLKIIAINSIIFGFLLLLVDRWKANDASNMVTERKALFIGLSQILSVIPGVSRLGICLTMARLFSLGRRESLTFSGLTAIPVLFLAGAYSALENLHGQYAIDINFLSVIASFVLGYLSLRIFIRYIGSCSFCFFGVYRIVLGLFLLFL